MGIRVASTIPANDASKAVCGASECSLEDSECSCKKGQRDATRRSQNIREQGLKIAVKVNKLHTNTRNTNECSGMFRPIKLRQ